jgi:3-oxoadipate CoA-transferase beta subunit
VTDGTVGWSDEEMARLVGDDLADGWTVNLGIGMPTLVARHLPHGRRIILHSENGIFGMGRLHDDDAPDPDVIDAGKTPVALIPGAAITDHVLSFSFIRSGRLDAAVLGAFQVSEAGDLANWALPGTRVGSIGGAMDIAVGAARVWVMMRHRDRDGRPKLVRACSYPLTAAGCVKRVYTELLVADVTDGRFIVRSLAPGVSLAEVQAITDSPLLPGPGLAGGAADGKEVGS